MQADTLGKERNYLTVEDAVHLQKSRTGKVSSKMFLPYYIASMEFRWFN